jgi:hypothetical protein
VTTTRKLIDRIRREFLGSRSESVNKLSAAVDASTTTLTFQYALGGIAEGARLSIDLEDIHVWSATETTKTAIVERGFESTTATTHALGSVVRVSPRVSDAQILDAVNNELRGLYGEGIFRIATTSIDFSPSHSTYALPVGVLDVYKVHYPDLSESDGWYRAHGWIVDRHQDTTDFPSGISLTFAGREWPAAGTAFRVTYKTELGTLATLADNVETTTGTSAIDLLVLGAGMRLTRGRETARNLSDAQGSTRRATEVPPGAELGSHRALLQAYQQELFRERSRLLRLYPTESKQW